MASWFPLWQIEGAALHQPATRTGEYTIPMHVKGVVRYVTPYQKHYDGLARITFAYGISTGLIAGIVANWLRRRRNLK